MSQLDPTVLTSTPAGTTRRSDTEPTSIRVTAGGVLGAGWLFATILAATVLPVVPVLAVAASAACFGVALRPRRAVVIGLLLVVLLVELVVLAELGAGTPGVGPLAGS